MEPKAAGDAPQNANYMGAHVISPLNPSYPPLTKRLVYAI